MSLPGGIDGSTKSPSNCVACDRPDSSEDMVACDGCGSWYHYSCADVDGSVANLPWTCGSCGILNQTPIPPKGARKVDAKKGSKRLTVPAGAEKSSKVSVVSKGTSRKSKKSGADEKVSSTSSARARLALELKMVDEQDQIRAEELQAELVIKNKKLLLEKQNRDRELALEGKKLAEEKAFQEKQLEEEEKTRKAMLEMKRLSLETKKNIVRQFSQRGSEVSSVSGSEVTNSEEKVRRWLQKSGEQTEGNIQSTSAAKDNGKLPEISGEITFNEAQEPIFNVAKKSFFSEMPREKTEQDGGEDVAYDVRTRLTAGNAAQGAASGSMYDPTDIGPTSRQLAARQVMGKDLPTFSGNPED
ncbi:uncharacterized protein LOC134288871 [Aedes albopictus]|uniref:PHD-type domain-containing protein n=1 Tax=Aedes albopictus TaxID=7160 RepID=A0ABM1ZXK6_AEDAL